MNYAFLPDLSALAILIVILALVRRSHNEERANAWLLGLLFTLIEAVAHTFYASAGMPNKVLHVIVLDCYLLAGLVFLWAAGDPRIARSTRLLYLALNGLPLFLLETTYGLNLRFAHVYVPAIVLGLVLGVSSAIVLRRSWRYALLSLAGWAGIAAMVANGRFRPAVYWSLACVYAIAALGFYRRLERRSTGRLAIVTGFSIWSLCFLLHPWVVNYGSFADIASHVWNMQKSLISIGMILVMLEEQVSNNEWLALHDELTGLPNRRLFGSKLSFAIEHCNRRGTSLALVVLDLNGFKQINDSMGHVAGDQVLREVAGLLRKSVRATDTVARLGGDEFTIVATDMANEHTVERFVESIRIAVERPILVNGQAMSLTASMGSAMYPNDAKDSTKLMRVADQRMYFLKKRPVQPAQIAVGQA
ncbi:MAG: GGDEF domain-containing protein [Acidobacteriaceae bacterium]|jgi:diguanylate cyclase (GGDEF)-like protein